MTFPDILKEFMLDCPIPDMHYFVYGLIKTALINIAKENDCFKIISDFIETWLFCFVSYLERDKMKDFYRIATIFPTLGTQYIKLVNKH